MLKKRLQDYIKKQNNKINLFLGEVDDLKLLGQGGNGLVFEGSLYGEQIALKFLINENSGKTAISKEKRFLSEFLNIQRLPNSTNLIKYISYENFNINDADGEVTYPVIIMDKYDCNFSGYVTDEEEKDVSKLFHFLTASISYIHSKGIIHRDIKPENILCKNEEFFLADFGIASYNPDMFELKGETKKGERLGNRLFSAPEQENGGIEPHETMDIYALGQILQWYCTGYIHRGTQRTKVAPLLGIPHYVDLVIDKCIANSPEDRFQKISDINEFINSEKEKLKKIDPFKIVGDFGDALGASFPKNLGQLKLISDKLEINRYLENLSKKEFGTSLWWYNDQGSNDFKLRKLDDDTWLVGFHEVRISAMWIYFDINEYKDFVFWHLEPMESFGINDPVEEYDEVGLVDNEHYITRAEYDNNYAEINGNIVKLSEHNVETRGRDLIDNFMFITTRYHNLNQRESEKLAIDLLSKMEDFDEIGDQIKELIFATNRFIHPEIAMCL
jgi:serine/threonine protein kinase